MKFDITHEIIVDKSRFIGYVIKDFNDVDNIKNIIIELKKTHKKSRHVCYAYKCIIKGVEYKKYSDDGEPTRTAGIPILSTIENIDITNILVIVVRYFGGKKLGASKLLRTYRKAARESIELLMEKNNDWND